MPAKYPSWEPEYQKVYRLRRKLENPNHRKEASERARKYYKKNKEKIRQRARLYYGRTKEEAKARAKKWATENRERFLALKKARYYRNHEAEKASRRISSRKQRESGKVAAWKLQHKAKDPGIFNRYNNNYRVGDRSKLGDFYIRQLLMTKYRIPNPTAAQITERRAIIAAKRSQKTVKFMMAAKSIISNASTT